MELQKPGPAGIYSGCLLMFPCLTWYSVHHLKGQDFCLELVGRDSDRRSSSLADCWPPYSTAGGAGALRQHRTNRQVTERGCSNWGSELEPGKGSTVASFIPRHGASVRHIMDASSAPQPGSPRQHLKLWLLAGIQIPSCLVLKPGLFLVHRGHLLWGSENGAGTSRIN